MRNYTVHTSQENEFTLSTTRPPVGSIPPDYAETQAAILFDILARRIPGIVMGRVESLLEEYLALPFGKSKERDEFWKNIDRIIGQVDKA